MAVYSNDLELRF